MSNTGLTTPGSLTLVNAGGSNRNGQQVFVEKWLNAVDMMVWERVVPMPLPRMQQAQAAPASRSNSQALPNINREFHPPQEVLIDPNMGTAPVSMDPSNQAFLDSSNQQLPVIEMTSTEVPRPLTGSEIDALFGDMPVDTEMIDGEVGGTIVVQPKE